MAPKLGLWGFGLWGTWICFNGPNLFFDMRSGQKNDGAPWWKKQGEQNLTGRV